MSKFVPMTLKTGEFIESYKDYLESEYWKLFKELYEVKVEGDDRFNDCMCCGWCRPGVKVEYHHISYDNIGDLENELYDVMRICPTCHEQITKLNINNQIPLHEAHKIARRERMKNLQAGLELADKLRNEWKRDRFPTRQGQQRIDELLRQISSKNQALD